MALFIDQMEAGPSMNVGGDNESASLNFLVKGSYSDVVIIGLVATLAPATYTSPVTGRTLFQGAITPDHQGAGVWHVGVDYGPREPKEAGDPPEFSFDISTDSVNIKQSLTTLNRYPSGTAPDLKGAINFDGKETQGVDIMTPKCTLSYKVIVADDDMTDSFKRDLSYAVGTTNDATYKGYAKGELLITGISGRARFESQDWELSISIAVSKNKSGISVGAITGINKPGWAYLWTRYEETVDGSYNPIPKPVAVYVEQVYEESDFDDLPL